MQITSTVVGRNTPKASSAAVVTAQNGAQAPEPIDTATTNPEPGFFGSVGTYGLQNGVRWGNGIGTVSGYLAGGALATAGLYAGALGGTTAGAAIGLGVGPAVAAVGSSGALDFVKTTFSTTGTLAKAGMILGTAALAVGAWETGNAIGKSVGIPAGFVIGAPIGLAEGTWNKIQGRPDPKVMPGEAPEAKEVNAFDLNAFKGVSAVPVGVFGALGAASGGVGGALLGGAALSGKTLIESLLAQDVTWSAISGSAAVGALVGGGVGLILGARGGFKLGKGVSQLGSWAMEKLVKEESGQSSGPSQADELTEAGKGAANSALVFTAKLSPRQVGLNIADTGMAAAHTFSNNENVAILGNVMGGLHTVLAVGYLIGAADKSSKVRATQGIGHGLIAAGNFVGANGGGAWAIPLMGAGMLVNTVNDYREHN